MSAESILENGLSAIPWQPYMFSKTSKYIEIQEYQYVTLVEGDTLLSITLSGVNANNELNNNWKACESSSLSPICYVHGEDRYTLPKFAIKEMCWQARSLLEFNVGPDITQTLIRANDSILLAYYEENEDKSGGAYRTIKTLKPEDGAPLSIRTSKPVFASTDTVDTRVYTTNLMGEVTAETDFTKMFKVEVFSAGDVVIEDVFYKTREPLVMHNLSDGFTKIACANLRASTEDDASKSKISYKDLTLSIKVPTESYGLMAFYYIPEAEYDDAAKNAGIIFNTTDSNINSSVDSNADGSSDVNSSTTPTYSPVIFNNIDPIAFSKLVKSAAQTTDDSGASEKTKSNGATGNGSDAEEENIITITTAGLEKLLISKYQEASRMDCYQKLFGW